MRFLRRAALTALMLLASVSCCPAQWTTLPGFTGGLSWHASAYLDSTLYCFGGLTYSGGYLLGAQAMNVKAGGPWRYIAGLPAARIGAYAAAIKDKIYIVGGQTGASVFQTTVLEYDPLFDIYLTKSIMPAATSRFAGAVVGEKVYVIGGWTSAGKTTQAVYVYDVRADAWSQTTSFPTPIVDATATAIGDSIYVVGGQTDNGYAQQVYVGVINGTTIGWKRIADYPMPITRAASGEINGRLYVAGGANNTTGNYGTTATYAYDNLANAWTRGYSMPSATFNVSSLVNDGSALYYVNGYRNPNVFKLSVERSVAIAVIDTNQLFIMLNRGEHRQSDIAVRNDGVIPLDLVVDVPTEAQSWLSVSAPAAVAPGEAATLSLVTSAEAVSLGDYRTTVALHTNDPERSVIPIDVRMYVREGLIRQATNVVIEYAAASWCWWCPDGEDTLAVIKNAYPYNAMVVAYHGPSSSQDMLTINEGSRMIGDLGCTGYPQAAFQRRMFTDEAALMTDRGMWSAHVRDVLTAQPSSPMSVQVIGSYYDPSTKKFSARLHIVVTDPLRYDSTRRYGITAVVTEDSINYRQVRYDPTQNKNITLDPYYHFDVARMIWPGRFGSELAIPEGAVRDSMISPGTVIDQDVSFVVANVTNPTLANVVFMVHEFRPTKPGLILHGQKGPLVRKALSVVVDRFKQTIGLKDTARFVATVSNTGDIPHGISLLRTLNDMPNAGWNSRVCIDGSCYDRRQDTAATFMLAPGDSAIVELRVYGGTSGHGLVKLHIANDSGETFDPSFDVTTLSTSDAPSLWAVAGGLSLDPTVPTPAADRTTFSYQLAFACDVDLSLFTLSGERAMSIAGERQQAGSHQVAANVAALPAGTYLLRLTADGVSTSRLVTVMR